MASLTLRVLAPSEALDMHKRQLQSFAFCHWILCCLTISGLLCPLLRAKPTFPIFVLLTAQPGMPTGVPPKDQQSDGEQTIVQECNPKQPHRWKPPSV